MMILQSTRASVATNRGLRPWSGTSRRGITIIEVMVLMTGVAAMLTLCAITIQLLLRLNTDGHARLTAAVALERLSRQIREDAHASDDARIDDKAEGKSNRLRLRIEPGHDVIYESRPGAIVRTETKGGKTSGRESYALAPRCAARFEIRDEGARPLVALIVTHDSVKNPTEPPRPLEVIALRGKDRVGPLGKPGGKSK